MKEVMKILNPESLRGMLLKGKASLFPALAGREYLRREVRGRSEITFANNPDF